MILILLGSCGKVKEAFSTQKKDNTDEFLVEKKSPLVMPPDYYELPVPKTQNKLDENSSNIESLILNNEKEAVKDDGRRLTRIDDRS